MAKKEKEVTKICITGGSKGIGKAIVGLLKNEEEEHDGMLMPVRKYEITDFSRASGVDLEVAIPDFNCDILILNAGRWWNGWKLNYEVPKMMMDMADKKMHIILILSNAAYQNYGNDDYTTAKAGLLLKARRMQKEGHRISTISPGTVNTDFWAYAVEDNRGKCLPIQPEEIAQAVKFVIDCPSIVTEMIILPRGKNDN